MADEPYRFFTEPTRPRSLSELAGLIPLLGGGGIIPEESRIGRARSAAADVVGDIAGAPAAVGEYFFGTRPTGTPVEGTVTDAPITTEEEDLFKRGFAAIQGQQNMGATPTTPPMSKMPPSPTMGATPMSPTMGATPPSPSVRGVGELIGFKPDIPGQTLTQFMQQGVDPQGRLIGAGTDAFEQASREREARLAQEERLRAAQRTGSKAAIDAAQAKAFGESQGILSQLEPTQLTYLMGQLGYDISPKDVKPTAPTTPTEPVVTEVREFDTYEEADAAGLPIGTKVKVGGRDAIIT